MNLTVHGYFTTGFVHTTNGNGDHDSQPSATEILCS